MPQIEENNQLFSGHDMKAGLSWRLFVFLLISFSVVSLAYIGLEFGYKSFLTGSISDLDSKIEQSTARVGLEEQQNLISFYSQTVNLNSLLRNHPFISNLFPFLENSTNTKVVYSTVTLTLQNRSLVLDGLTDSYETLVSQVAFLEQHEAVERVDLGLNSIQNNLVAFNIDVILKPNFFALAQIPK